jgi:hypothetical protein
MQNILEHIKKLQLKIWLQKSPGERLYQALKSNEELFLTWKKARESIPKKQTTKSSTA